MEIGSTVAFRTSTETEEAFAAVLASFEAQGWAVESESLPRVFMLPGGQRPVSGVICRGGWRLGVSAMDVNGTRYVRIGINPQDPTRACNTGDPRNLSRRGDIVVIQREMPTLQLPPGTRGAGEGGRLSTGWAGGRDPRASARILSPVPALRLIDDLGDQMSAQGWSADSSWSGTLSTGSGWTREAVDGTPLWGTIEIVALGDETFDVSFRMLSPSL